MMMMRPVTALLSYSPCHMGRARGRGLEWLKLIRCASDSEVKFEVRTLAVHRDSCRAGQELRPPGAVTRPDSDGARRRPSTQTRAPRTRAFTNRHRRPLHQPTVRCNPSVRQYNIRQNITPI